MSLASNILAECRKLINDALQRVGIAPSGEWSLPNTSLPSGGDTGLGFTPAPHDHAGLYDARTIWERDVTPATPTDGQVYVWDQAANVWSLGAGGGGSGAGFKAYLTVDTDISGVEYVTAFGNEIYDTSDSYDPSAATWTPPAGPVVFVVKTQLSTNLDIAIAIVKNGGIVYQRVSGRYAVSGTAFVELAWQDLASGDDYYQLVIDGPSGTLQAEGTFWAGMSGGGGGGGGSGGGGVPAPFSYMVDSDGAYLVDSDGRYLYEAL